MTAFTFQQLPAQKPVRTETGQPPQQPVPPPEEGGPPASSGGWGMLPMLLMMLPLIVLMLWMPRAQQKKQEKAIAALKKGDRVITQSGLVGKLLETGDRYAKLEVAPGVKIEVLRSTLLGMDTGDNQPDRK